MNKTSAVKAVQSCLKVLFSDIRQDGMEVDNRMASVQTFST